MTEAELRTILEKLPDDILCRGGQILYPGIDTLQPTESGYYFLGFNPDAASPALPMIPSRRRCRQSPLTVRRELPIQDA